GLGTGHVLVARHALDGYRRRKNRGFGRQYFFHFFWGKHGCPPLGFAEPARPRAARRRCFFYLGTGRVILRRDTRGVKTGQRFSAGRPPAQQPILQPLFSNGNGAKRPVTGHTSLVTRHSSLNNLQLGLGAVGRGRRRGGLGRGRRGRVCCRFAREEQALAVFLGEDAAHRFDRDRAFAR